MDTVKLQAAFMSLVQQHERLVQKVCTIYVKDDSARTDLFQEIILQAWKAYPKFEGRAEVSTWLYRIALNTAISHYRRQQRSPDIHYPEVLFNHPHEHNERHDEEQYKLLQRLIDELTPLDKALLLLYMEDKSYNEIATIIGISVTNVGTKLSRIKDKLKQKAKPFIDQ